MKQTYTAVIERAQTVRGVHESEPYEAGWADEALIFVRAREGMEPDNELSFRIQISPDGIEWVDHHAAHLAPLQSAHLTHAPVREFGNWLRVVTVSSNPEASVRVSIYVVLKG